MSSATLRVTGLRVEHRSEDDTLGLYARRPRLSWRSETDARDWLQRSYELEVLDADSGAVIWRSGVVDSDGSHLVAWDGPDLVSRQRCRWRVGVTGSDQTSAWSDWSEFEVGLLEEDEWSARFIVPDAIAAADPAQPVAYLRHEWSVPSVVRARLYVTSLGVYEVECNGRRVGDQVLAPGWTSFRDHVRVEVFDVTDALRPGRNAIGVSLADGWYGEHYGFDDVGERAY